MSGRIFLTLILVLLVATPAAAETRVAEFTGSSDTTTRVFRVEAPWVLDWRLNGDYEQMMGLEIMLVDGKTGRHIGRVVKSKVRSNGVRLFHEGGSYRLKVSSTLARWQIKIDQLTREEAELYKPR